MNTYRALPDNLHDLADATQKYLTDELGLSNVRVEEEIDQRIDFRPTLSSISADKHIVCAEVTEELYAPAIERFVLDCRNHALPVKLYVAVRKGQFQAYEPRILRIAKENGMAILEVTPPSHGTLITSRPVSLSLGGLRAFNLRAYPPKYRESLSRAIETFKTGNPAKGCSDVYDELEQLTRRIGKKCSTMSGALKKNGAFNWDKESWANALEFLRANIDTTKPACKGLTKQLISRQIGLTEYRNDTGHKPSSLAKKIERDVQLRTRFESAMDELLCLINAARPIKV